MIESNHIPLPDLLFPRISIDGMDLDMLPSLGWSKSKVFIFDQSKKEYIDNIAQADEIGLFVADDEINITKIIDLLRKENDYGHNDSE